MALGFPERQGKRVFLWPFWNFLMLSTDWAALGGPRAPGKPIMLDVGPAWAAPLPTSVQRPVLLASWDLG